MRTPQSLPRGKSILMALSVAISILTLAGCGGGGEQPPQVQPEQVSVKSGTVQGFTQGEVQNFLGVPYAAPPVGALRWQPPQPVAAWTGVAGTRESAQLPAER